MKKTIRLTESELMNLVKRIVTEQTKTLKGFKDVTACLKPLGFESVDTGGKYNFFISKKIATKDKVSNIEIVDQEDGTLSLRNVISPKNGNREIYGGDNINFKKMTCEQFIAEVKKLIKTPL